MAERDMQSRNVSINATAAAAIKFGAAQFETIDFWTLILFQAPSAKTKAAFVRLPRAGFCLANLNKLSEQHGNSRMFNICDVCGRLVKITIGSFLVEMSQVF
jgi:hypothetical protein